MASRSSALAAVNVVALLVLCGWPATTEAHTQFGAYNTTCPQAEEIVFKEMTAVLAKSPDLAGPLLRLFSVDCLLGGCEGSILLNSTANNTAEKDSPLNKGLRGFDVVDSIKAMLETACPGVVSCADVLVLALAARDSVRITKGPYIPIGTGRQDGNRSSAADVAPNSPKPGATVNDLIALFARFNLTAKDLAVLSGAHTIGKAHCSAFSSRLYNFTSNSATDPTLDANYTTTLRGQCKAGDLATLVDLDPASGTTFDLGYYRDLAASKGLLSTDAALLLDADTRAYVLRQANATVPDEFFADFAVSFVNMSKIGVLTHHKGEVRRVCSAVNPPSAFSSATMTTMSAHTVLLATSLLAVFVMALVL